MILRVFEDKQALGTAAAERAGAIIRDAIRKRGCAHIVAATGASQFEFLEALVQSPRIDWTKVELFHLDEYIGPPMTHPASFCKYLRERLIAKTGITRHHLMDGAGDINEVIRLTSAAIRSVTIDVAFAGIGENGHLAFNDPPANFETNEPYIIVALDDACRQQQIGEGWFAKLEDVPAKAISMSVREILRAREVIAVVPEARKAAAVKACCEGPVSPLTPASILQTHAHATIYLDRQSASLLAPATLSKYSPPTEQPDNNLRAHAT